MEAKFENKTTMNKRTCKDYLSLTWPQNSGLIRYVLLGAAVIGFGYGIFQVVTLGLRGIPYAISLFIMGGVALYMGQFGYRTQLASYIKKQQLAWGAEEFEKKVYFYDEYMEQVFSKGKISFEYKNLTKILQNKNSIVFCFGSDALLVQKNGFIKGNAEDVVLFVEKK